MLTLSQKEYYQKLILSETGVLVTIIHGKQGKYDDEYNMAIIEEAINLVNRYYAVDIRHQNRSVINSEARHLCVYLIKERIDNVGISAIIAKAIHRHRTTIICSYQKAKNWVNIYDDLRIKVDKLGQQLDEFITRKNFKNEQTN
ncbi:MAG: hypothetical protein RJA25_2229 [Bacteroidota bacterium]|jgi:chromosomal replication initiation ATPase DnaA